MRDSIERHELFRQVWDAPLKEVAQTLGMSAGGVGKLCDRLGVPRPDRNYWRLSEAERLKSRPSALPPAPLDAGPGMGQAGAASSKDTKTQGRKRLPIATRKAQMLDIAGQLCLEGGLDEVTINRVAKEAGISEAQAHNCFARRIDLLSALARREIDRFEESRRAVEQRGRDRMTQIVMSTVNHLSQAGIRGALIQALLLEPEVRELLREDFEVSRKMVSKPIVDSMASRYGMSEEEAYGSNWLVTALNLRAGSLVSDGRLTSANAIRLCLPMVMGSIRSHSDVRRERQARE